MQERVQAGDNRGRGWLTLHIVCICVLFDGSFYCMHSRGGSTADVKKVCSTHAGGHLGHLNPIASDERRPLYQGHGCFKSRQCARPIPAIEDVNQLSQNTQLDTLLPAPLANAEFGRK